MLPLRPARTLARILQGEVVKERRPADVASRDEATAFLLGRRASRGQERLPSRRRSRRERRVGLLPTVAPGVLSKTWTFRSRGIRGRPMVDSFHAMLHRVFGGRSGQMTVGRIGRGVPSRNSSEKGEGTVLSVYSRFLCLLFFFVVSAAPVSAAPITFDFGDPSTGSLINPPGPNNR